MAELNVIDVPDGFLLNPFIKDLNIKEDKILKKLANTRKVIFDVDAKSVEKVDVVYAAEHSVDRAGYIKMYMAVFPVIATLSRTALRVILHLIANEVKYESDKVVLDPDTACRLIGFGDKSQLYSGVRELCERKVIARSNIKHLYWINPNFFYYGDRRYLLKDKQALDFSNLKEYLDGYNSTTQHNS